MIRSTFGGFSTALSALQANQKRLDLVGQNLANMNTPGYTRQQLETSSLNYSGLNHFTNGSGTMVGFGVRMDRVSQIRDPFLDGQYRSQMSKASYTNARQEALDSLANTLDESDNEGIHQALENIKSTLKNMQDVDKVNDPILESELRLRMQDLTNLLNSANEEMTEAQKNEFEKLDGTGTSEQGAVQRVNDLLSQIGNLNRQIKDNQIFGHPSLELMDERNLLLDELSSYVPIDVTYSKDPQHSDWPDDLKVTMKYTDTDGTAKQLTLIDGTKGTGDDNHGRLSIVGGSADDPTSAAIGFDAAPSSGTPAANVTVSADKAQLAKGSIQAGLDMLGKDGATPGLDDVRGYQYYLNQLDTLANEFATIMNGLNNQGTPPAGDLFVDKTGGGGPINAANIGISDDWINGNVHISTSGDNATDTILNMLDAMSAQNTDLGDKSFVDFMNNLSTILASDSSSNANANKTNITVLNTIQNSKDSISGVSMDEEATNMMAYVSAYNAASRLMTAMDEALDTLINGTGRVGR